MIHIGSFATSGAVQTAVNERKLIKSYVAYVRDEKYIDWNTKEPPHDYSKDYLTFEIISAGTVNWYAGSSVVAKTIEYSMDSGNTWSTITSNTGASAPSISVNEGDKILFKGSNVTYSNGTYMSCFSGSTAVFNLCGNIMSLVYGDNFVSATTLTEAYTFSNMFFYTKVVDASNLVLPATTLYANCYRTMFYRCTMLNYAPKVLPATTLVQYCYYGMFQYCTNLTQAPSELPATVLINNCYTNMFSGCTNINHIKALFTTSPVSTSATFTANWLAGVSVTGTFEKNPEAVWDQTITRGASTVPVGWTIQDAT